MGPNRRISYDTLAGNIANISHIADITQAMGVRYMETIVKARQRGALPRSARGDLGCDKLPINSPITRRCRSEVGPR